MVFLAGAAVSFACTPAHAQAATEATRQALTISLGAFNENRRDDADSPLAYAGSGLGERIDYERTRAGRRWYVSLEAGSASIAPTASGLGAHTEEEFGAYTIGVGTDWRLRGSSAERGEFALGVQIGAALTVARHMYADVDLTEQTFDFAAVTVAPVARWTRRWGTGALTASLAVPLLAWVDHPYADVRYANQFVDLHYASPAQLRQANGVLSYAFNPASRYGITAAYRVDAVELDELQTVRRFTQSLLVSVTRRFGPVP
jgi:hypothetical protein